jgi:hypothetical protein
MPTRKGPIDFEFAPAALIRRIVRGALDNDPVRLHGAIDAALEIHGAAAAERDIFVPARRLAGAFNPGCHTTVADAITRHADPA